MDGLIAALIPLVILSIAWVVYCLLDLQRSDVQHLPKWGWALLIVFSVPVGGIVYIIIGRAR